MRAFLVVNCQSALVWLVLRSCSQAAISSMRVCLLGIRRSRLDPTFLSRPQRIVFEIVVVIEGRAGARRLRRRRTLQELRRVAVARLARFARRALGRIAANLRLQLYDVEEDV